jgi:DNA-binding PadR family transcriptional regulator
MTTQEKQHRQAALQLPVEVQRTVHTPEAGTIRSRFMLHPSYRKLAEQIDALNRESTPRPRVAARPQRTPAPSEHRVIERELILTTLSRFPDGIQVRDLCQAALGSATPEMMHRIYALLAREVARGLVDPQSGRGAPRKLTDKGRRAVAEFELIAARQKLAAQRTALTVRQAQQKRVNGVFDYARKIEQGILSTLEPRKAIAS